jgi:hypothetical protein
MLPRSITPKSLKPIAGRHTQIGKHVRGVQKAKLAAGDLDQVGRKALADYASKHVFREGIFKSLDHHQVYQLLIHPSIRLYQILIHQFGSQECRDIRDRGKWVADTAHPAKDHNI